MKVLIVNYADIQGGVARATYRLHKALLKAGIQSEMLVLHKSSNDQTVTEYNFTSLSASKKVLEVLDKAPVKRYKKRTNTLFSSAFISTPGIVNHINSIGPDVVHMHMITYGMLRPKDLKKINAPIVWSLHDMWAFTGGCHYDEACGKYKSECGRCPVLGSDKKADLSQKVYSNKIKHYSEIKSLTIVGLSSWMADSAKSSSLMSNRKVVNLPNPINTDKFKPYDKNKSRELLDVPQQKKLILFGATGGTLNPRKGFSKLSAALKMLESENYELVIFGAGDPINSHKFNQKIHYLGYIHDEVTLRLVYSASDVMIVPSIQENLANTIMESMACGTPVVGFDIGGNGDMISHKENGYLAKPFDVSDLSSGINYILKNPDYRAFNVNARENILRKFDSRIVSEKYIELYKEVTQ